MFHGGWRRSYTWVATFICCVDNRHMSTSAVKVFHHTTVATEKERWWILEWDFGTFRRESLLSTVLVLHSNLLQAVPRFIRLLTKIKELMEVQDKYDFLLMIYEQGVKECIPLS